MTTLDTEAVAAALSGEAVLRTDALHLTLGECRLRLRSNSAELLAGLRHYFAHVLGAATDKPDLDLIAIDRDPPHLGLEFVDWKREPGKTGRKDAYVDLPGARLVLKVRTGMVFLQSETRRIAAGPCIRYDNQVINFINAQYMNWLQHRGWLICHASGLVRNGRTLGIAGFSGGGKSTLMLRLLDHPGVAYLTNDRLFVRREDNGTRAVGIPKLPRINPGTIVHNPVLHGLIDAPERERLLALPSDELWHIEDKYDVFVSEVYGPARIVPEASLGAFLVLNWKRGSGDPLTVKRVDLNARRDLLAGAIMKSPGPFYQFADGRFLADTDPLDAGAYLDALDGVPVFEASGGVDFEALTRICLEELIA